jgi:hypothetical protein
VTSLGCVGGFAARAVREDSEFAWTVNGGLSEAFMIAKRKINDQEETSE